MVSTHTETSGHEDSYLRLQARTMRFTLGTAREFRISPDGSRVLFLRSASGTEMRTSLWSFDVEIGRETVLVDPTTLVDHEELSPEERAARERARTRGAGVLAYSTDAECRQVVFPLSGNVYLADVATGDTRELPVTGPVMDPRLDPTGRRVAYVSGRTLRVIDVDGTNDRELVGPTDGESDDIAWGTAEFLAAEEMNRSRGYWWSPDGERVLVTRTDSAPVRRWHIADPMNPDEAADEVAYPAAGTANCVVGAYVVDLAGTNAPTEVAWDDADLPYLTEAHWSAGGPLLLALQTRDQRRLVVLAVDPATGATDVRQEISDPHWTDVVSGAPAWTPDGRLVTVAARDGAYRLLVDGEPVTPTGLQVRELLDAGADDVLFSASEDDPTQQHIYTTNGGDPVRLSDLDGLNFAARTGDTIVLIAWTMAFDGPRTTVTRGGKPAGEIASLAMDPPLVPNVTMLTVGERDLRCALLFPTGHEIGGDKKLPVLLDPYGGPHAQRVLSARTAFGASQWLADQGFAVLITDGRGTPGRGPDWDRSIAGQFGDLPVTDQADALQAVAALYPDLDTDRVAIRGWSFGGYLAAAAVLRRPDVFHAALAGAPVSDWRLYDTHYTERYLGHPDENAEVYDRNSLIDDAKNLTRPLLLVHGLADDNVFAAHTLRLSTALLAAGRQHNVLPLSGVTHMLPSAEAEAENFMVFQVNWLKNALGM
ncbi:MAG TPA: prolyl oligopeptidase family serine peptidase [Pseudonocardiaceae bacterium]|jgi:dipeptidyl-peptidase-4|nr:prolyl oligopeptidase family serine peptidase [Pseudonocardiaceae bacterium]